MNLLTIRQAVVNVVAAALPGLHVEAHGGRFDSVEEIKRHATRGQAALVAIMGLKGLERSGGETVADLVLAVFIVTGDRPGASRDTAALALVQAVADLVPDNRWGLDDAQGAPSAPDADNLYAASLDKLGVALWGVSWRQRFAISALDPTDLAAFLTCAITTTQAPDGSADPKEAPVLDGLVSLPQE